MSQAVTFGKIYIQKIEKMPLLPDMNLLILKDGEEYQAICINLEIDSCGESINAACESLVNVLHLYISEQIEIYKNRDEAIKSIITTAFSQSKQKDKLFERYNATKQLYFIKRFNETRKIISKREEIFSILKQFFYRKPIEYSLREIYV